MSFSTNEKSPPKKSSRLKKTTSFLSKSFGEASKWSTPMAKQAIAEKFGKNSRHILPQNTETGEKYQEIEKIDNSFPKIYRKLRKEVSSLREYATSIEDVSKGYSSYASSSSPETGDLMASISSLERDISQFSSLLAEQLETKVILPLAEFTKKDLSEAKESKKTWNHARLAYEAAWNKLEGAKERSSSKKNEIEAEYSMAKANFEKVDRDSCRLLDNASRYADVYMIETASNYLQAYETFFKNGLNIVQQLFPKMNELREQTKHMTTQSKGKDKEEDVSSSQASKDSFGNEVLESDEEDLETKEFHQMIEEIQRDLKKYEEEGKEKVNSATTEYQDVGDTIQALMEKENRSLEMEWIKKDYERKLEEKRKEKEQKRKEKKIEAMKSFDIEEQLRYGSKFHHFLLQVVKEKIVPTLIDQMKLISVDPVSETLDSKVGPISFGIGELAIEEIDIPVESINITYSNSKITIIWTNVTAALHQFSWYYRKETFPKLKDDAFSNAKISNGIICINIHVTKECDEGPVFYVDSTLVKIGTLKIKISGSVASLVYNVVLSALKNMIKSKVQIQLQKEIYEYFQDQIEDIMNEWD